jgi:hypothetical protein
MLKKYSDFRQTLIINENIAGAKKILKDTYILNKAIVQLDTNLKIDGSGLFLLNRDGLLVKFIDVPEDIKNTAKQKIREIKISDEEQRNIEKHPSFIEIREFLGDRRLGWSPIFTHLFFREGTNIEELKSIYADMNTYNDLLNRLRRPINNYIDPNIDNNTEQLIDDLEEIKRYRKLKKFIDEFNSDLKRDYANSPKFFKDRLIDIATAFDDLGKDESSGKINPKLQRSIQKRFFDKIGRYKTTRELTAAAESFLKSESNAGIAEFYRSIDNVNRKYGSYGVKVLYDEGGLIIMEIKSFSACKDLFSNTSWCIAQYLGQWNSYVGGDNIYNKQYAIINNNLPPSDNKSIIGITIEPGQKVRACHLKNDAGAANTFHSTFNNFEEELGLEKDFIWSLLTPMSDKEIDEKKRRIIANREVVKKGLTLEDIKKYIIEDGADVNAGNGAVLDNAVQDDDIETIKFLLDYGASTNLRTRQEATVNKTKSFEVLKLLITKGSEITPNVFKTLSEDEDAVKFCLDNGLNPNFEQNMPLRLAIKNGNLNLVKLLEEYDVDSKNSRQMNTKHAAEWRRWDILEYFINKGGSFIEGFDKVLVWVGHSVKIPDNEKIEVLSKLQKYIDDGRVKVNQEDYKIGRDRYNNLDEVIKQFGSIKNWVISMHPNLIKIKDKQ